MRAEKGKVSLEEKICVAVVGITFLISLNFSTTFISMILCFGIIGVVKLLWKKI